MNAKREIGCAARVCSGRRAVSLASRLVERIERVEQSWLLASFSAEAV